MTTDKQSWLIDVPSGQVFTRGDLVRALPGGYQRICRPESTVKALMAITRALVRGTDLLLLDTDFSDAEVDALGIAKQTINRISPERSDLKISWAQLPQAAAGQSSARLGLFTSGSTGLPKLVWQSAANLARAVRVSDRQAQAVWALAYNPTHVAGIQVYLQALANGCPVVNVYGLDRPAVLTAIEQHGVTHLSATPSFYRLLLPEDQPLICVQSITLGGEVTDPDLLVRLRRAFPCARLHNVYASTEAGTLLVAEDDVFQIPESLSDCIRLHEDRLWVHRSLLGEFDGKHEAESEDRKVDVADQSAASEIQAAKPQEFQLSEWYDTGDVVEIISAEPLRFKIVARARDWVNVGGSKVNPQEVEGVISRHQDVQQVRVFGRENSLMGNILCAEVVLAGDEAVKRSDSVTVSQAHSVTGPQSHGLSESALRAWLGARLQPHKVPRIIRFVDKLAVTRTGKLSRQ